MGRVDLHTHTTASDGLLTPAELIRLARERGLTALAITDHDTVSGLPEAVQAAGEAGVELIPGIEISTSYQGQDVHLLGYYVDYTSRKFVEELKGLKEGRHKRNERIIERLNELGIPISMEKVVAKRPAEGNVGRPHIAQVLVDMGVVASVQEAFDLYLGKNGKAYVSLPRLSPQEGVKLILRHGGIPVLAHPGLYGNDQLIGQLLAEGLEGIEVYHPDHSLAEVAKYERLAQEYQLLITGGSDYHGEGENGPFHGDLGSQPVGIEILDRLKALFRKKRV